MLYLFVGFWQLVFANLCPRVVGTAADFSGWGRMFPFFLEVFISGGVVLNFSFLRFVFFIGSFVIKCGLVILINWLWGPCWPTGPCMYSCVGVFLGGVGKIVAFWRVCQEHFLWKNKLKKKDISYPFISLLCCLSFRFQTKPQESSDSPSSSEVCTLSSFWSTARARRALMSPGIRAIYTRKTRLK